MMGTREEQSEAYPSREVAAQANVHHQTAGDGGDFVCTLADVGLVSGGWREATMP